MNVQIQYGPAYAAAVVHLVRGEELIAEGGSFVCSSSGVRKDIRIAGSVAKAIARKAMGNESFLLTRFQAEMDGAWVMLAPKFPGDIARVDIPPEGLLVQPGAYLAHMGDVDVSARPGTVGRFVGQEGAFAVTLRGRGTALLTSYGAIQQFTLGPGEVMEVDAGHYVAAGTNVKYKIGTFGGVATAALSGEGLVATLTGPGPVFIQTRSPSQLRSWLHATPSSRGTA